MLSWLRHVKHCQSVQMNWKPSTSSWDLCNEELIVKVMNTASDYFKEEFNLKIFKNNQSFTPLLKQSEIDVLGLEIRDGRVAEVFGVDAAFHENGLNYGSVNLTLERVIKKMVRTTMIILGYFDLKKGKIIFATPKVSEALMNQLLDIVQHLNGLFKSLDLEFEFIFYSNNSFECNVFIPVIKQSKSVADTSELFMRSMQMYNLFTDSKESLEKDSSASEAGIRRVKRPRGNIESLDNEHKVAYYLSRFEHDKLFPNNNQSQAFEEISEILGVKLTTIRNKRDMFDPFCNNIKDKGPKRKGWWQNDRLSNDMERIYIYYQNLEEKEIEKEIRDILNI